MDEESRKHIAESQANSRFPTGIGRIERRECRAGGLNPAACMFCPYGHMLECHYPYTCDEVECSHYEQEVEAKRWAEGEESI
jgi:hypothetical protein